MKRESRNYSLGGVASLDTTQNSQAEILSDIRSIKGVTTVGFTPEDLGNRTASYNNKNYKGKFNIKIDNFPFEDFDRNKTLKSIADFIRKMPAVNYFRASLESIVNEGFIY